MQGIAKVQIADVQNCPSAGLSFCWKLCVLHATVFNNIKRKKWRPQVQLSNKHRLCAVTVGVSSTGSPAFLFSENWLTVKMENILNVMRGDIHQNRIVWSILGNISRPFGHCIAACVSVSISLQLAMVWMHSLCVQSLCFTSFYFIFILYVFCLCSFISCFPFNILFVIICTWCTLFPSTMWWCLCLNAARRKRFRGCVTVCPLTISLYSSHLTVLMGFALPLHSAAADLFVP